MVETEFERRSLFNERTGDFNGDNIISQNETAVAKPNPTRFIEVSILDTTPDEDYENGRMSL